MSVLIKKVTILDPTSPFHEKKVDVLYHNGSIQQIAKNITTTSKHIIAEPNAYLSNAWVDIMADYCDPGYEYKETINTGLKAAVNGGFAHVFVVPNTAPIISNKTLVEYVLNQIPSKNSKVYVLGAVTKNCEGKELAEMMDMHHAGAIAFTDGWKPIQNPQVLLKALEYVKAFNGIIVQLPINEALSKGGLMNEGINSVQWGMPGIPNMAEHLQVQRDLEILKYTKSRLHISGITTQESVQLIKAAKKEGLQVTCSVTPYHLLYTDDALSTYNSNYKVAPPLRSEKDRKALIKALSDGTIDCIATHHRPHEWDAKAKEFEYTETGMMVQETTWAMLQKAAPMVEMTTWISLLVTNPKKIFGLSQTSITEGANIPITLIAPEKTFSFTNKTKASKGINSPLLNQTLTGQAFCIL